jgi:hypothetical protein
MRLPELSSQHREFNRRVALAEDRAAKYVVPLYGTRDRSERYVVGSGMLLQIEGRGFLVTAAHVLEEQRIAQTNIEVPGRKALLPLSGRGIKSRLPESGRRADDRIDIGILPLTRDMVDELLENFAFLDSRRVDPSDVGGPHTRYTFAGYPSSKHEGPRDGVLAIEPVRYTSEALAPEKYPAGFQLETHVSIDFDRKRMVARTEQVQTPPDPHGVSGGGVFRIGTWDEIIAGRNEERLVGVAIEVNNRARCLLGTRISYPLEMIRATFPELSPSIPRSSYLHVDAAAPA